METAASWAHARASAREARKRRAAARVVAPIRSAGRDPLSRRKVGWALSVAGAAAVLGAALLAHAFVLGGFYGVTAAFVSDKKPDPRNVPIELTMVTPPEPEPEPEPVAEPEAEPEPKPEPKPRPKPPVKPKPEKTAPPPPDPTDAPPEPPKDPPKKVRRIVGLNLESTAAGGDGPSFGVGNTRMGRSAETAEDPSAAKPIPKGSPPPAQRKATRAPVASGGPSIVKPKFAGPRLEPKYPDDYRAQGLEATVTVEIVIGADGRVKRSRIVSGSKHEKFQEAALLVAKKQRWVPAKRDGEPVEFTITIPYRFTLKD